MPVAILGLDVGTNATKAVLYSEDGRELAVAGQSYPLETPRPGWVEQDAERVWQAVLACLREVVSQAEGWQIAGLALAAQAGSIIPCDEKGSPVYPMITWLDQRSAEIVAEWEADGTLERIRQMSGWRPFPGLPLPSIAWLQRHRPDIHAQAKRYLGPPDFCIYRLTGKPATDLSAAAEMVLVDIRRRRWHPTLCEMVGVDPARQAELGWAGRPLGRITPAVAVATGLPAGTPVIAGGHDQCCACVGMGMLEPGGVMLSTGTAWVITAVADSPEPAAIPEGMDLNYHAVPERWTVSQYLGGFGATVEWWLEQVWQSPDPEQPLARSRRFELLDRALEASEAGCRGLLFLPGAGSGQGAFVGLTLAHTRTDMTRAILEGAAFEVRRALDRMRHAGLSVQELWIAGGASSSPVWPQILADVTRVPIVLAEYPSWAALGAAVLAGRGVGLWPSLAEGVRRLRPPVRRLLPDLQRLPTYRDAYARYLHVAHALERGQP
ncbi:MAG: hypothetical protein D6775_03620 [Caldilineae bacterium]|nr:MAG: hypothetical protein D6775_03620 [Caldilineae bacterium]